ncbi:MAG: hypothetical protein H7Y33_14170, partial [Cytophagales bacterium]|nr:hypothetical protein [Rhizobacter sp.]
RATWAALSQGDTRTLSRLATALVPASRAHAATAVEPDLKGDTTVIDKLFSGDTSVTLGTALNLNALFNGSNNANCYGPSLAYSSHENFVSGMPAAAGTLPSGDLGLWTATEAGGKPCVAAELNARVSGVKGRVKHGLRLMAVMRLTVAKSSLTMPAAGGSLNMQAELQSTLSAVPALSGVTVNAATIALDSGGAIYTYRLLVSQGTGTSATSGEVILKHTPGGSHTAYSGVMQVAGFHLSTDPAFSCSDEVDGATGRYKVAQVSTVKYSRNGAAINFGSRDGQYCGHASGSSSNHAAQVASFTGDGQLDPTVKISGNTRSGGTGWRAGFTRFAGSFDKDTVAGDFLFAWQAGTGDGNARGLAVHADYNSATEARALNGYFAFTGDVATSDGSLLGMICNWAGPGNSHTPASKFQSQTATLSASATDYALGASKITYAPTTSCSSTTTSFDVDVSGSIASGEGVGTVADLDTPSGANTVQQEIELRGFAKPSLF